jgi:ligand-binding sensor domain-containing protein
MWIGTYDNGVSSVSQSPDLFETYYPQDSGVIWALADADRSGLWIGGKDGLLRLNRNLQDLAIVDLDKDLGPGPHDVRAILSEPSGSCQSRRASSSPCATMACSGAKRVS